MSKKSLADLKNAFAKPEGQNQNFGDNYPFWNIADGESVTIRFIPDANNENPMGFLLEKKMHKLEINGQRRSIPCLKMYDKDADCPICALSQEHYKAGDKITGKKYYRNLQHIARAVIVKDPIEYTSEDESAEGKIKTLTLSYQIHESIKDAFESGDLDEIPFDYEDGYDFVIKKKMIGSDDDRYASYTQSKFVRKSTPISKYIDEDKIELVDLATLLPENPGYDKVAEYLEAHLNGSTVDESTSNSTTDESSAAKLEALKNKMSVDKSQDEKKPIKEKANVSDDLESEADAILAEIYADN